MSLFGRRLEQQAEALLSLCRANGDMIATAESCTGGLLSGLLTSVAGSSDVVDCGFVTYSYAAKTKMLGVQPALLEREGAVNAACALAMLEGCFANSRATLAIAITGIAGPGGGSAAKPVGLVYFACGKRNADPIQHEKRFGEIGRENVRSACLEFALKLLNDAL